MRAFLIRRLVAGALSVLAATAIVFGLSRAAGDPLLLYAKPGGYGVTPEQEEALRQKLRLIGRLSFNILLWLTDLARGDFGKTLLAEQDVNKVVGDKLGRDCPARHRLVGLGNPDGRADRCTVCDPSWLIL